MKTITKLICALTLLWFNTGTAMAQCKAAFTFSADSLHPRDVQFANSSTGNQLSYYWNFGDGTTSDMQNPKHTYANFGGYNVCLYTYSKTDTTCKSTICDSVRVFNNTPPPPPPACQAYFYAVNDTLGNPNLVHVKNYSQGSSLSYSWNFGDGSPLAKGIDPQHQYTAKGTYNICLSITSSTDTSCHSQYCTQITTHDSVVAPPKPCQAYFYALNDSLKNNLVHFQNHSQGNALSYVWNFNDGSVSHDFAPNHQFSVAGTYNVCLNITSSTDTSCHSQYCINVTTHDSVVAPPKPCQAYFYAVNDTVTGNLVRTQNHSQGNNLSYAWNFGDGSAISTGFDPHHQYAVHGTYNVCLNVTSSTDTSCHSQYCTQITTHDSVVAPPKPCQAYFYVVNDTVTGNLVRTQNHSQGNNLSYAWNFGDGSAISTGFDPHHQYAVHGTYNVCLNVTSSTDTSCHSQYCTQITTHDSVVAPPKPCQAYFYAVNDSIKGNLVHTQNHSQGNALIYSWNFGDGKISHDANPSHEYAMKGAYTICLNITSQTDTSCHSEYCSAVSIKEPHNGCKADFYTYVSANNLNEVHLKNLSTGNAPLTYMVNYGDGSQTTGMSHKYTNSGTYSICLTISDSHGCSDTKCKPVTVGSCKAGFYLYKDSLNSHSYHAVNTSWGHNIHYTWEFGDGATSHDALPSHVYQNFGKYYVCVSVSDSMGCNDSFCDSIIVTAKTNGQILFDVTPPEVIATAINTVNATLSNVSVYPNPVADIANLNITSVSNDNVKLIIVNVLGQVSKSINYKLLKGENSIQLDVADLPEGIYYLTVSTADNAQQVSLKFVK